MGPDEEKEADVDVLDLTYLSPASDILMSQALKVSRLRI